MKKWIKIHKEWQKLNLLKVNITSKEQTFCQKRWLEKNEGNHITIALILLYARKEKIYTTYVSKNSSSCEKKNVF